MSYPRQVSLSALAVNGGTPIRSKPFPERSNLGHEEKAAVSAMFDDAIRTGAAPGYNGVTEMAFCEEFAGFMGGGFVDAVSSGTTAVYVALRALEIEPFTEVIVSPITDPGGVMPVALMNCIPMVSDTEPGSFNVGPDQVEELISPRTSAIVIAHMNGDPADIEGIIKVASRQRVPVIEDCAQSHAAKLNGKYVGSFGDMATFSTMFGKHMSTGGQGGLVYTQSEDFYWKSRRASDRGKPFGLPEGSTNVTASLNLNLNDMAAAIGRVQLRKLPEFVAKRQTFVQKLEEGIHELGIQTVSNPPQLPGAESSHWYWRARVHVDKLDCDKDTFANAITAEGPRAIPYYIMPHEYDWFRERSVFGTSGLPWSSPLYKGDPDRQFLTPNAHEAMATHFRMTLHESWGDQEVTDILAAIKKVEDAYLKPEYRQSEYATREEAPRP